MTLVRFAPFLLLLVFAPEVTRAWAGPAVLGPENPTSTDALYIDMTVGECDAHGEPTPTNDLVQVEIGPGAVDVTVSGVEAFSDEACVYPAITRRYPVGPLPAGNYSVSILWRRNGNAFSDELVATTSLTVVGGVAAAPVPAVGTLAIALCVLLFMFVGYRRHTRHRR